MRVGRTRIEPLRIDPIRVESMRIDPLRTRGQRGSTRYERGAVTDRPVRSGGPLWIDPITRYGSTRYGWSRCGSTRYEQGIVPDRPDTGGRTRIDPITRYGSTRYGRVARRITRYGSTRYEQAGQARERSSLPEAVPGIRPRRSTRRSTRRSSPKLPVAPGWRRGAAAGRPEAVRPGRAAAGAVGILPASNTRLQVFGSRAFRLTGRRGNRVRIPDGPRHCDRNARPGPLRFGGTAPTPGGRRGEGGKGGAPVAGRSDSASVP